MKSLICLLCWGTSLMLLSCSRNPADNPTPPSPPPASPPSLSGSIYGSVGGVFRLDLATGHPYWYTRTYGFSGMAPFVDSGSVYSCDVYGASAIDTVTGKILWSINYSSNFYRNNNYSYHCSPLVADSLLYTEGFTGSNGYVCLYGIHKTRGIIVWQKLLSGPRTFFVSNIGQPKIIKDKIIVVGRDYDEKNQVFCFNRFTGNTLWIKDCTAERITPSSYPQADEGNVYISDIANNNLYALDINDGHTIWTSQLPMQQSSGYRPIVSDKYLIGFGATASPSSSSAVYFRVDKKNGAVVNIMPVNYYLSTLCADTNNIYVDGSGLLGCIPLVSSSFKWQVTEQMKKAYDSLTKNGILPSWEFAADPVPINGYVILYNTFQGNISNSCYYNNVDIYDKQSGKLVKSNGVNDCLYEYHGAMTVVQGKATYYAPNGGL